MTAAKAKAREFAEWKEWTVVQLEKAGLRGMVVVRSHEKASKFIMNDRYVLLGQLGEDYLIGELL